MINPFDKLYGTRALQHVIITVDVVSFEKLLHDMILIIMSGIPNPDKSLNFVFQTCCYKLSHRTFVVLYPDNQDKVNYQ